MKTISLTQGKAVAEHMLKINSINREYGEETLKIIEATIFALYEVPVDLIISFDPELQKYLEFNDCKDGEPINDPIVICDRKFSMGQLETCVVADGFHRIGQAVWDGIKTITAFIAIQYIDRFPDINQQY